MAASSKSLSARIMQSLFGSRNDRLLKRMHKNVHAINQLEGGIAALSDEQLRGKTTEFRQRRGA
jgi:preprotein translocase subunit SecA